NVYLFGAIHGMTRRTLEERCADVIARAGITHLTHAPLKDLSLGQIQRLGLSVFAETDASFLIFDQVLGNVHRALARTSDAFFRRLADSGRTIVMTSHDPEFLRAYCERAIWVDGGRVRADGPFEPVMREYERWCDGDGSDAAASSANGAGPGT